jgi:hypothetical protein
MNTDDFVHGAYFASLMTLTLIILEKVFKLNKENSFMKYVAFFFMLFVLSSIKHSYAESPEVLTREILLIEAKDPDDGLGKAMWNANLSFNNLIKSMSVAKPLTPQQTEDFFSKALAHTRECVRICEEMQTLTKNIKNSYHRRNMEVSIDAVLAVICTPGGAVARSCMMLVTLCKNYYIFWYDDYSRMCSLENELEYHASMEDFYMKLVRGHPY